MPHVNSDRFSSVCSRAGLCAALLLMTTLTHAQMTGTNTETSATGRTATDAPSGLRALLPQSRLSGKSRLTVWGFDVYDASLWVTPGFNPDKLTTQPFALELAYLRNFTNSDIAERSIVEMRRLTTISDAQAKDWTAAMLRVIPNVKKGDRIMGIYRPGTGATFLVNGKSAGEIMDAEFARLFFGIWLSPKTSEPQMRTTLLAGAV
jgi:hypothetical protein